MSALCTCEYRRKLGRAASERVDNRRCPVHDKTIAVPDSNLALISLLLVEAIDTYKELCHEDVAGSFESRVKKAMGWER